MIWIAVFSSIAIIPIPRMPDKRTPGKIKNFQDATTWKYEQDKDALVTRIVFQESGQRTETLFYKMLFYHQWRNPRIIGSELMLSWDENPVCRVWGAGRKKYHALRERDSGDDQWDRPFDGANKIMQNTHH